MYIMAQTYCIYALSPLSVACDLCSIVTKDSAGSEVQSAKEQGKAGQVHGEEEEEECAKGQEVAS